MPFSGSNDSSLPQHVQDLSETKRKEWVGAFNGRFEDCRKDDKTVKECESSAFAVANAAVGSKDMDRPDVWEFIARRVNQEKADYNPLGGTKAKACANCTFFISPNDCTIVQNYPTPISPTGLSRFWEAVEAVEPTPLAVVIVDDETKEAEGTKAKHKKTEGGVEYGASDFAVVPDAEKPSTWKLRLAEESSGNFTVAQVARAITAMQPSGFRGNKVELGPGGKDQAVGRIRGAISKLSGADDDQKKDLRQRLNKVKSVIPPFAVFKDQFGDVRWLGVVTNNFEDREKEIFTEAAHKDYIDFIDRRQKYPELWVWHEPGAKIGQADWAEYSDGFVVMSGIVDPEYEEIANRIAEDSVGMSHGFLYKDEKDGLIPWYRSFEVSVLPSSVAANPWTGFTLETKEVL